MGGNSAGMTARGGWDREGRNEVSLRVAARGGIEDSGFPIKSGMTNYC